MRSCMLRCCPCLERQRHGNDVTNGVIDIPLAAADAPPQPRRQSTKQDGQDGALLAMTLDRLLFVVQAVVTFALLTALPSAA